MEQLAIPDVSVMPLLSFIVTSYALELQNLCPLILETLKSNHLLQVWKAVCLEYAAGHAEEYAAYTDGFKTADGVGHAVALSDRTIAKEHHRLRQSTRQN